MKNIESYFDMLPYNGNLVRNSNKSGSTQIGPEEYSNPEPEPQEKNWFYVENIGEETNTLGIAERVIQGTMDPIITNLEYTTTPEDDNSWTQIVIDSITTTEPDVMIEFTNRVYLRGVNDTLAVLDMENEGVLSTFIACINPYNVGGNIMSLLYGKNYSKNDNHFPTESSSIVALFSGSPLVSAENLELPATTLTPYCYSMLFAGSQVTSVPELPATTLVKGCYANMFGQCLLLNSITVGFTDWLEYSNPPATMEWTIDVSESGNFNCPESLEIKIGSQFIPEGWTVNGEEPIIPPEPGTSEYDPTKTYEIGDHVYYQGLEYQAIQNVPTNENNQVTDNWNTYWEALR